jgi:TctA family transporter
MFLTEFQVTFYFFIYLVLVLVSAVFVLMKDQWTFMDKLLRLLLLFLIPVLGFLVLVVEQLIKKSVARLQKKETS